MAIDSGTSQPARIGGVEVRSIDYLPLKDGHGKVWRHGPRVAQAHGSTDIPPRGA